MPGGKESSDTWRSRDPFLEALAKKVPRPMGRLHGGNNSVSGGGGASCVWKPIVSPSVPRGGGCVKWRGQGWGLGDGGPGGQMATLGKEVQEELNLSWKTERQKGFLQIRLGKFNRN